MLTPTFALLLVLPTQLLRPSDELHAHGDTTRIRVSTVAVAGQPFASAVRAETLSRTDNDWEVEVGAYSREAVTAGDVVHARFYIRSLKGQAETGEARATMDFQTLAPDWSKSVTFPAGVPRTWKRYDVPFVVRDSRPAGATMVAFRLGYGPQIVEIGGVELVNYGKTKTLADLPRTPTNYRGEEPNAPWRRAANGRINRLRKGPLTVVVQDRAGKPVRGASVRVAMKRHQFGFGSAVDAGTLFLPGPDGDRYRKHIVENYNVAAIENHLKWPYWETWSREDGLKAVKWLRDNEIRIRAHNIIWPGYGNLPPDLRSIKDKDRLNERIDAHIREITAAVRGQVDEWDVVNEPFANHDVIDILGPDAMPRWFRLTRQGDPKPLLVLNDYPRLDGALVGDKHLDNFYKNIGDVKRSGAPIGGIGFQCHFGSEIVPPTRVLSGLDRFGKFGLPIVITEFDMDTTDEDLQRRYMRDFLTVAFSHPSVRGVTMWGFWEGRHWLPNAALYRRDWSIKPSGQVWLDLVRKAWWTNATLRSDRRGVASVPAFYGDYELTITVPGKAPRKVAAPHTKPGDRILVRL